MEQKRKKLVLIDAMALIYRGHFALIRNPVLNSKGMNTSAVLVFLNSLLDLLQREKPTHVAAAFDTEAPTHRHKVFEAYKAQREAMPEDIARAIPYVEQLCEGFNIPVLKMDGWEADDIIGSLALEAARSDMDVLILTPDKDFGQLVDERIHLAKPSKSGTGYDIHGPAEICAEWNISAPSQVMDILALMGDVSDNVPGVPGVGKKTAQKLIQEYGTVEKLVSDLSGLKGKLKQQMETFREQALISKHLVTIETQIPSLLSPEELAVGERNNAALQTLFDELEFRSAAKRVFGEDYTPGSTILKEPGHGGELEPKLELKLKPEHMKIPPKGFRSAESGKAREELVQELLRQNRVALQGLVASSGSARLQGLAFAWGTEDSVYLPLPEEKDTAALILREFHLFWEADHIEKLGHRLKRDLRMLREYGIRVKGPYFDHHAAAWLSLPDSKRGLADLAMQLLNYRPLSPTKEPGGDGDQNAHRILVAQESAMLALRLGEPMQVKLEQHNQDRVFREVECPLIPALVEMEYEGIRIDVNALKEISSQLLMQIDACTARIQELAGEPVSVSSPKQLGNLLFDKLNLDPEARRTKKTGQYATGEQVLQRLSGHEIVQQILEYRLCSKLKSTYVDVLPGVMNSDTGRVHTTYEQAATATGRLQSHDPNLQNIPIRNEIGREIRKAFVARDEKHSLLSADYSQIELRIAAEMSRDEALLAAFQSGLDIHTATAMQCFGVEAGYVTESMRRKAKSVNFGILYGISAFGLSERSEMSRQEAKDLIETYFSTYLGVKTWLQQTLEFARENGFVQTLTGRRRYLRDIHSRNATVRKAAERMAVNAPIQGTAADMIKLAMGRIQTQIEENGLRSRMLLQVHDELVFDLADEEEEILPGFVEKAMREALPLQVPIVVEMGIGKNWLDAH